MSSYLPLLLFFPIPSFALFYLSHFAFHTSLSCYPSFRPSLLFLVFTLKHHPFSYTSYFLYTSSSHTLSTSLPSSLLTLFFTLKHHHHPLPYPLLPSLSPFVVRITPEFTVAIQLDIRTLASDYWFLIHYFLSYDHKTSPLSVNPPSLHLRIVPSVPPYRASLPFPPPTSPSVSLCLLIGVAE